MGLLKALSDFLLGKDADIFDKKGRVVHKFSEEKWKKWDERLSGNPEYDWHNHAGKEQAMLKNTTDKNDKAH
jgi:hypothetical protein